MVKKVVGYDDRGNKVFERDARVYDQSIANTVLGLSIGDIVKAIPIIFLCGMVWANQQSVNQKLADSVSANAQAIQAISIANGKTLLVVNDYISRMDSYLSATTGKRFRNGEPQ